MGIKNKIDGSVRLIRLKEYLAYVVVTTFLGAASAADGELGIHLVGVLAANWLATAFGFMFNQVEEAENDALDPVRRCQNPISNHDLQPIMARWICYLTGSVALILYAALGIKPFLLGLATLLVGFLYSWKPVRLKNIAFFDLLSQGALMAGLQFLSAYFTFSPAPLHHWVFSFLAVTYFSIYTGLYQEMKAPRREPGRYTVAVVGPGVSIWLMGYCMLVAVSSALMVIYWVKLFPNWVLWLVAGITAAILIPIFVRLYRNRLSLSQMEPLQKPLEIAAATGLSSHFVWPILSRMVGSRLMLTLPVLQHWLMSLFPRIF